eukprot:scaffold7720_cov102-Skeletonema_dohrnii-CCMP3373.AAC.1
MATHELLIFKHVNIFNGRNKLPSTLTRRSNHRRIREEDGNEVFVTLPLLHTTFYVDKGEATIIESERRCETTT